MLDSYTDAQQNSNVSGQEKTALTFRKEERLCSKKQIEQLFEGGKSCSMSAFPLRTVFRFVPNSWAKGGVMAADSEASGQFSTAKTSTKIKVELLISVPKRQFKRANKRNRVKRQVREAYRKNRHQFLNLLEKHSGETLLLAFIWLDDKLHCSQEVEKQVSNLLKRIAEKK